MFRILLIEQTSLFRTALAAVLSNEDDLDVVGHTGRIDETLLIAKTVRPDVAVINLDLLTNGNRSIVGQLNDTLPECAILLLAEPKMAQANRETLGPRVRGFVGKDITPGQLAGYIRQVAAGERVVDPTLAVAALFTRPNPLTERELEVLRVAASGVPSAEIAASLHLSVGTVRNYLSAIMHKTRSRNRLEAVHTAEEAGWL